MNKERVHLVLASERHARYRAAAEREGLSLSAWLRRAAEAQLEDTRRPLGSVEELDAFFSEVDACHGADAPREPDWHELYDGDERVSAAGPSL